MISFWPSKLLLFQLLIIEIPWGMFVNISRLVLREEGVALLLDFVRHSFGSRA